MTDDFYIAVRQPGSGTKAYAGGEFPPQPDVDKSVLASLRALDFVMIDDSENEPPDFTTFDDDLGS